MKPKKDTKICELGTDDNEPMDLTQIPNAFNKYFIELGDELCNDIPPSVTIPEDYFVDFECPANTWLYFKEISETEILRLLHGFSASKVLGMDQISARILTIASHIIVLTYINFKTINSYGHISN